MSVSITIGIVSAALATFVLGLLKLPSWLGLIAFAAAVVIGIKNRDRRPAFAVIFTVCLSLLLSSSLFGQFFFASGGVALHLEGVHDAWWHVALEESLIKSIPPANFLFSPQIITGYHYLTDIFLASVSRVSGISTLELYSRWMPLFLVWLFVDTALTLFLEVVKPKYAYLGVAVLCFGGGLAFFAPWFFPTQIIGQSVFWLDQPGRYVINQQLLLSLAVVNVLFYQLFDKAQKWWFPMGLLLGSLIGIKVYGAVIILPFFLTWLSYQFIRERNPVYLRTIAIALVISSLLFWVNKSNTGLPFFFAPGWYLQVMMEAPDRLNFSVWEIHRQLFVQSHNYLRLGLLWLGAALIFLIGNFGVKILAVFCLPFLLRKHRLLLLVLSGAIVVSIGLPLLFLQKGVVWNSIQFMHYAQLPLVLSLLLLIKEKRFGRAPLVILVLSLFLGAFTGLQTIVRDLRPDSYLIYPKEKISSISRLNKLPGNKEIIVLGELHESSIVSALAKRPVYYSDPIILSILTVDFQGRQSIVKEFENNTKLCPQGYTLASESAGIIVTKSCD